MSTNEDDSSKTSDPPAPSPSTRQEPDSSLRALLPWLIPAIVLGILVLALMMSNKP